MRYAFKRVETVSDILDCLWFKMNGYAVGFEPVVGTLSGFGRPVNISTVQTEKTDDDKFAPSSTTSKFDYLFLRSRSDTDRDKRLTIQFGSLPRDVIEGLRLLLTTKEEFDYLVLDFSQMRPCECIGLPEMLYRIAAVLSFRSIKVLTRADIIDIMSAMGIEFAMTHYGNPEWLQIAYDQKPNRIAFYAKPSEEQITSLLTKGLPFMNAETLVYRYPWFKGMSQDIVLGNGSTADMCEFDLSQWNGRYDELIEECLKLGGELYKASATLPIFPFDRAQPVWTETHQFLRLNGVRFVGVEEWDHYRDLQSTRKVRNAIRTGAIRAADKMKTPRPKAMVGWNLKTTATDAIGLLERYKWFSYFSDHNVSLSVPYEESDIQRIANWVYWNWEHFIYVNFQKTEKE